MSNNTNKTNVPEAKEAMDRFKMEVANELGVPLSNGYNGNLTSAQNHNVRSAPFYQIRAHQGYKCLR